MKKIAITTMLICAVNSLLYSQAVGDTITIETFNYNSTTRDTVIDFSVLPNVSFEKILMKYNMRCKDGNVSTGGNTNYGCGEWDYSCNTYIYDSTRIDSVLYTHPNYTVSDYSGTNFSYTNQPTYDFFQYTQNPVILNSIISENQSSLLSGSNAMNNPLSGAEQSGKAQYLYTAAELAAAGFTAGEIDGFLVDALNGGTINFLRINIIGTSATSMDASAPESTGFTEVYFSNYNFVTGSNRIQFSTPYVWNGTDNIIIEFSFTNTVAANTVQLQGTTSSGMSIYANNGYHINLGGNTHIDVPTTAMATIQDEITVSFWAHGDVDLMPLNTTIIHANNAAGNRNLNLHLPWSNSRIYFDCGNTGSGYDRIDKAAAVNEIEGEWNHWAATKNTATGVMNLYLNGTLWHTGTGKTIPIEIAEMVIGKTNGLGYNYKGYIDELRIWDAELTQTEISNWMNINVDATHPKYTNLVAYYKMDEGSGATIVDNANAAVGTATSSDMWKLDRGKDLNRFFQNSNDRPNITLLQGDYDTTINTVIVLDSIQITPNIIETFAIASNLGTLTDDDIITTSQTAVWEAIPEIVYDAVTGVTLYTISVAPDSTLPVAIDLDYYRRWPAKFEIMSFVTPYGINLNMGINGETWTFDMTDYTPLFNGQKRFTMERGGQWQEDMDIHFQFIVGTPPRDILNINQIWRPESRGYTSILNDTYFPPRDAMMDSNGEGFKIRTSITGHGQEGEFIQRQHFVNINGGAAEFEWNVWKECAENPVYPQGGTWIYDRAGWCPGMPTDVKHNDITALVTPGQTATIDYGLNTASGSSNYIVNNQLVTYGGINHALDAAVIEISEPSDRIEFHRLNSICHTPKVRIQNTGSTPLTTLKISYWVNNATTPLVHNWTGNLDFGQDEVVELPSSYDLWTSLTPTDNVFHVELSEPNGGADEYAYNDHYASKFEIPEVMPADIVVHFKTNSAAFESSYEIIDENGNVVYSKSGMAANTLHRDTVYLGLGCYTYRVNDTGDDGINFWANNDGIGYTRIYRLTGGIVKNFISDFGDNINFNFTVEFPLSYEELHGVSDISLFPNPAKEEFVLKGNNVHQASVSVFNNMGKQITIPFAASENELEFDSKNIAAGIYFIRINRKGSIETLKLIVE